MFDKLFKRSHIIFIFFISITLFSTPDYTESCNISYIGATDSLVFYYITREYNHGSHYQRETNISLITMDYINGEIVDEQLIKTIFRNDTSCNGNWNYNIGYQNERSEHETLNKHKIDYGHLYWVPDKYKFDKKGLNIYWENENVWETKLDTNYLNRFFIDHDYEHNSEDYFDDFDLRIVDSDNCTFYLINRGDLEIIIPLINKEQLKKLAYSDLRGVSFSEDGKYFTFQEELNSDQEGQLRRQTYFIDVKKNEFIKKGIVQEGDECDENSKKSKQIKKILKDLNIREENCTQNWAYTIQKNEFEWEGVSYELLLTEKEISDSKCKGIKTDKSKIFELTLAKFGDNGKIISTTILQSDKELPVNRNCALSYEIENIYFLRNEETLTTSFAVILSYKFNNSKGPYKQSMRYLAVTGIIKNKME